MHCDIHDAELERVYPAGTILNTCTECVSELTGKSPEIIELEDKLRKYRERN